MGKLTILRANPLFAALGEEELIAVSRLLIERQVAKDVVIFQEQDRADALYLLVEGKVKIMLTDAEGREVIVSILGSGECFGEMGLFDGSRRSAQVMSMVPSRLLVLDRGDFLNWLQRNPAMAMAIIQQLARRLRQANYTISNLATLNVESRVARVLTEAAESCGDTLTLDAPPTQQDIASMVGASRERVNRALRNLKSKGFLRIEGRRIILSQASPSRIDG